MSAPTSSTKLCEHLDCAALAPILLSSLIGSLFLGIILVQAARYCLVFSEPRFRAKRLLVFEVVIAQIALAVFDWTRTINIFAIHFGEIDHFLRPRWQDTALASTGVLIQVQTQFFLLFRAYRYAHFSRVRFAVKWVLTGFIAVAILIAGAAGTAVTVRVKLSDSLLRFVPPSPDKIFHLAVIIWLSTAAGIDAVLCFTIAHELLRARRKTKIVNSTGIRTVKILRSLVKIVVNAGIILTSAQAAIAIAWLAESHLHQLHNHGTAWIWLPVLLLPYVYTLTLLSMLSASRDTQSAIRLPASDGACTQQNLLEATGKLAGESAVETVEYDWGCETSANRSNREGTKTVTGLPLKRLSVHCIQFGDSFQQTTATSSATSTQSKEQDFMLPVVNISPVARPNPAANRTRSPRRPPNLSTIQETGQTRPSLDFIHM